MTILTLFKKSAPCWSKQGAMFASWPSHRKN